MQVFNDRFTYANPALANTDVSTLTDAQLESLSPALKDMAAQVRRHSVLLRKKTAGEIYAAITDHADPRIALVLAAARDKQGVKLFPNLEVVKAAMFGPSSVNGSEFLDDVNNIFVQGIKRVSASLAASTLIGQLAQIEEQAKHAQTLEAQALADLDRIIAVPDLAAANASANNDEVINQSLFFEDKAFTTTSQLQVDLYLSAAASSSWVSVGTYSGEFNTSNLVVDLADTINTLTLVGGRGNILASPILSGKEGLHRIEFNARNRDAVIATELVTVRLTYSNTTSPREPIPFRWGVESNALAQGLVNSVLITVLQGKTSATGVANTNQEQASPTVLYFRRLPVNNEGLVLNKTGNPMPDATWATGRVVYRISPSDETTNTEVIINRTLDTSSPAAQLQLDKARHGQVALTLLNSLFASKAKTRALGALIRNDDGAELGALAGLELIAWSVTNPQTWLILDVLEIPTDIEMAVGNLQGPLTSFSNKPRSIRVESRYDYRLGQGNTGTPTVNINAVPKLVKLPQSSLLNKTRDLAHPLPTTHYYPYPLIGYERPPY